MGYHPRAAGLPRLLLSAALVTGVLLTGCSKPAPPPAPAPVQEKPAEGKSIDWWLQHLTLEEKVGQLLWFGLRDGSLGSEAEMLIADGKAGGFILFARQGNDPNALRTLTSAMQNLSQKRSRLTPGMVISVDHEGGLVQRWREPFTSWPGNMAIGATRSTAYAEQVSAAMAEELLAVGINMNLAPDADVNNNPANPVIGIRSFGEDPQAVAQLATAAIKGAQSRQVSAVAKHFPGHGDTDVDTHKAMPAVNHPLERLNQVELVPFRAAIDAGVDAIMTAHIIFPAVEPDGLPATLSNKVLTGLLKEKMSFPGVVVTDAIEMKAIADNYGLEKALVMAVQAGADALLVTESFGRHNSLHSVLVQAVKEKQISEERLNDAVRRQLTLKAKRGLLPDTGVNAGKPLPSSVAKVAVGSEEHVRLAMQVGADALTLVRNKHLPLKLTAEQQVLVVSPGYVTNPLAASIKEQHANVQEVRLDRAPKAEQADAVKTAVTNAAVVVYAVYNAHKYPEHQAIIRQLVASGKPVVLVGLGEPYDLTKLPEVQTYLAAYGYQSSNLQGVGALLFGKTPPKGKLPVSIPGLYPIGHGLSF